jgi:hypothetical protein
MRIRYVVHAYGANLASSDTESLLARQFQRLKRPTCCKFCAVPERHLPRYTRLVCMVYTPLGMYVRLLIIGGDEVRTQTEK